MRAKLLGAVLAALFAPLALAADVDRAGKVAAPTVARADEPAWNRTGAYVGLVGAYDLALIDAEGLEAFNGKLMAGAFAGYNFRYQGIVLGLEADWMFTGISASHTADDVTIKATTDHLVSLRARAGIPMGPALLYLTGGPAWQNVKLTVSEGKELASEREWQLGLVLGGGIEAELTRALFLRLEALHYMFPADGAPLSQIFESENAHTAVRLGLGFKLN